MNLNTIKYTETLAVDTKTVQPIRAFAEQANTIQIYAPTSSFETAFIIYQGLSSGVLNPKLRATERLLMTDLTSDLTGYNKWQSVIPGTVLNDMSLMKCTGVRVLVEFWFFDGNAIGVAKVNSEVTATIQTYLETNFPLATDGQYVRVLDTDTDWYYDLDTTAWVDYESKYLIGITKEPTASADFNLEAGIYTGDPSHSPTSTELILQQLTGKLDKTGDTMTGDLDMDGNDIDNVGTLTLYNAAGDAVAYYDGTDVIFTYGGKMVEMAKNLFTRVKATVAINEGDVVQYTGSIGTSGKIAGKPAVPAEINVNPFLIVGIATEDITLGQEGEVNWYGRVNTINTTGYGTSTEGTVLYFASGSASNGQLTSTKPTAPNVQIPMALLTVYHAINGQLAIRPDIGNSLKNLHDVHFNSHVFTDEDILVYDLANTRWIVTTKTAYHTGLQSDIDDNAADIVLLQDANMVKTVTYTAATGVLTFTHYDNTTTLIDLPLELIIESGYYDEATNEIVLVLASGGEIRIPVDDLLTDINATNVTFDGSATNYLTLKTNVQTGMVELDVQIKANADAIVTEASARTLKDSEHEKRIDTIEENLRKTTFNNMDTEQGTSIISLDTDVAQGPMSVKLEGMLLEQIVTDGDDFATTWSLQNATGSATSGVYSFTASAQFGNLNQTIEIVNGNDYYIEARIKADSALVRLGFPTGATPAYFSHSGGGTYEIVKGIISPTTSGLLQVSDWRTSGWTQIDVDYAIAIPLTNTPLALLTAAQISEYIPNYFEGIGNVNLNKRVRAVGKNIADIDEFLINDTYIKKLSVDSRNVLAVTGNNAILGVETMNTFKALTQYTFQCDTRRLDNALSGGILLINYTDGTTDTSINAATSSWVSQSFTSDSGKTIDYLSFTYGNGAATNYLDIDTLQIEEGSTATTYEAFYSEDMFIEGGNGYGIGDTHDIIEQRNGKLYKVQRYETVTFDGSESWASRATTTETTTIAFYLDVTPSLMGGNIAGIIYNSDFTNVASSTLNSTDSEAISNYAYWSASSRIVIKVLRSKLATVDVAGFKTWLGSNNQTVYYELATPVETELEALGVLNSAPNKTVYVDDVYQEVCVYSSGITSTYDISSVAKVVKINSDGSQTDIDTDDVTLTSNQISAITGAASGDNYYIEYYYTGTYVKGLTTLSFYNSMEDLRFPVTSLAQPASGRPDFDTTNICYLFPQNNTGEVLYIIAQMPHNRVIDSPIYPHIHCRLGSAGQPVMKIDYKWYNPDGTTIPAAFTTYTMNVNTATWSSGTISNMIYGSAAISGVGKEDSSILVMKLYRDDNVYVGDLKVDEFDIHYFVAR